MGKPKNETHQVTLKSPQLQMEHAVSDMLPQVSTAFLGQSTGNQVVHAKDLNNSRSRSQKRSHFGSLTATFSILAILVIWSVCTAARGRDQVAGVTRRRLSDRDLGMDDEEQSVLEECLALEADLGIIRPQAASPSDGDRSRRIAELVSLLSGAAAEYELKQGVQQAPVEDATFNEVPDSAQASIGAGILSRGCRSGEGSGGAKQDLEPLEGYASGVSSELKPDEWIEEKTDNQYEHSETRGGALSFGIVSVPQRGEASGVVSLVSANPQLPAPRKALYSSKDPCNHPYVRLPALEAGVTLQDFDPSGVFSRPPKSASFINILLELRRLFAQQTLNQEDANLLGKLAVELANNVWRKESASARQVRPVLAVVGVGSTFLAMDYLVSAIALLGSHMKLEVWWETFTGAIDTAYALPLPHRVAPLSLRFNTSLANRMLDALRIFKARQRLSPEDLIFLKRSLFFSSHTPPLFKESQFDPWRQDDLAFKASVHARRWCS